MQIRSPAARRVLRLAAPLVVALQLSACVRWVAEPTPAAALTGHGHRTVRIFTVAGTRLVLRDPQVSRDSLYGWAPGTGPRGGGRTSLPLSSIARVERRVSQGRPATVAAFVAVAAFTLVVRP
jgi:hypothetical protein